MPRLAVEQVVGILDRLESRPIAVHAGQCTRLRHRRSTCTRCADACPVGAISWQDGLQVDAETCTSCGICATVCPAGALEAHSPTNGELLAQVQKVVKERSRVAFACPLYVETYGGGERFISVNCLGRLDESILVGAVSLGAQSVWLMDGACEECAHAIGRDVAAAAAGRADKLLEAFGVSQRIAMRPDLLPMSETAYGTNGAGEALSRRGFFKLLARDTVRLGEIAVESVLKGQSAQAEKEVKKGELPVALPAKRRLLLDALRRIGKLASATFSADDGLWAGFGFGEDCTGCQMCAFFCPTGALSKVEQDGKVGVAFRISHCTNCGLCQDICYREAVVLSDEVDLSKVVDDSTEVLFMREANAAPWRVPSEESVAGRILESLGLKTE